LISDERRKPELLEVNELSVAIPTASGVVHAVSDVSFSLTEGRMLGIVGESGCGKSMLCKSIIGILPSGVTQSSGTIINFRGRNLVGLSRSELNKIRGFEIGMIFQDPMTALNPVMNIGRQISEPLIRHLGMRSKDALDKAVELMASVGIPNPSMRLKHYPHELSGGLRQRVVIAIALSCGPRLLIADEPTTALDVTVQAGILDLLEDLQKDRNMAVILVTHDLGVAAMRCQDIAVMYGGKFVEMASAESLFTQMRMPYTKALLDSLPLLDNPPHTALKVINGQPPNLALRSKGCCFAPRCDYRIERCHREAPRLQSAGSEPHRFACWNPLTREQEETDQPRQ
jgi:oligopeptide/dipeptide ABC transporter ATP-binding protein